MRDRNGRTWIIDRFYEQYLRFLWTLPDPLGRQFDGHSLRQPSLAFGELRLGQRFALASQRVTAREGCLVAARRGERSLAGSLCEIGGERGIRTLGRVSPTHAFQACSLNHSDISPFRINGLRAAWNSVAHTPVNSHTLLDAVWNQRVGANGESLSGEIVSDPLMSRDYLRRSRSIRA